MPKIPVIKKVEINRSLLGKIEIRFNCPRCKNSLICEREEIGTPDDCPHCGQRFMVSDEVEQHLQAQEQEKEQARIEAQKRKEAQRQQKIEQAERRREQKEQQRLAALEFEDGYEDDDEDFPEKRYEPEAESYAHLISIARFLKFAAYLTLIISVPIFLYHIVNALIAAEDANSLLLLLRIGWAIGELGVGILTFVIMIGVSEAIKLAINVANDVRAMRLSTDKA